MVLGSGIRDPTSGKKLFRIPDPGVKKAPDPGYGSATLVRTNLRIRELHAIPIMFCSTVGDEIKNSVN
jgi:hypothetical protein